MAKKVRFPLEMEHEVQVRSMEELRDNFSLVRVLEYLKNGKLIIWLQQRYAMDIAEEIEKLDLQDSDLAKKVCQIFDVPYDETAEEELEKAVERAERIKKLREYTDDREYEKVVDNVAFDQDELYDLLDEDAETIYLCGNQFSIPLGKAGVSYIGINEPTAVIDSTVEVDWNEKNISVENVVFDSKYQEVLDDVIIEKNNQSVGDNKSKHEIKVFEIPSELFDKYNINVFYTNDDGKEYSKMSALVPKSNPDLDNMIQKNIYDFTEDDKKIYILSEYNGKICSIYDKMTHKLESFSVPREDPLFGIIGRGMYASVLKVNPDRKIKSINTMHILFFGEDEKDLMWMNFDGSEERCIFRINSKNNVDPILVNDGVFYYGKDNGDGGYWFPNSTFTICSFNVYEGSEKIICNKAKMVTFDSSYLYIIEKQSNYQYQIFQVELKTGLFIIPWKRALEEEPVEIYISDENLMGIFSGKKTRRIAKLNQTYGLATKEECEKAGFFRINNKKEREKEKIYNVKLLDNGSLIVWNGDYSTNHEISDKCNSYTEKDKSIYYVMKDGTFGIYNFQTEENKVLDILISTTYAIQDDEVYYRAYSNIWDKDYFEKRKKLFILDLINNNVQIAPYNFYDGIEDIVNYNETIFVQEGTWEFDIIFKNKTGEWELLLQKIRAYCFKEDDIYFARDRIEDNSSYHEFYKLNLNTKKETKIKVIRFYPCDLNHKDGYINKIEFKDNKLLYEESNGSYRRTKEFQL